MEFIEINENKKTIRKFKGAENRQEAIDHVLNYNRLYIFSVKSLEEHEGSLNQFFKDLEISDFKKIGLLEGD